MTAQTVDTGKLWAMIEGRRFGMLTVRGADGRLYSRPMTIRNGEADHGAVIWFFMSRAGQSVTDLTASPDVNVAYADPASDKYVSVSGTARLVEDPVKKQELWQVADQAWFPDGPEDSDLALVAILVAEADYWDAETNKAIQIFKLAPDFQAGASRADRGRADRHGGASPRLDAVTWQPEVP
jgi:general stress protein 26